MLALEFHEEHHVEGKAWSQFHELVIRNSDRETASKMLPHPDSRNEVVNVA